MKNLAIFFINNSHKVSPFPTILFILTVMDILKLYKAAVCVTVQTSGDTWPTSFYCCFMSTVNSYGHVGTVRLPNHTVPWQA